jgi:hypothetical protein
MQSYILSENVLSDNFLLLADKNEKFKGGYIAIIKEYEFKNAWSDKEVLKKFNKKETLFKYLEKKYPEIEIF